MTKKRARRTRAEWSAMLADMFASGQSMSAYGRDHGVSLARLSYWKKALEDRKPGHVSAAPKAKPAFSEIVVVPRVCTPASRIEGVTRGGSAVRLEGGFDAALLREVLQVVESC